MREVQSTNFPAGTNDLMGRGSSHGGAGGFVVGPDRIERHPNRSASIYIACQPIGTNYS